MRPLVPYYGGKARLASRIVPLLPRHTVYVEPFCGGAAVMFAKPWPPATNNNDYREVINDLDGRLMNLYRVAQRRETFEEFRRLVAMPYSRAAHQWGSWLAWSTFDEPCPEAAARYWTHVCQAFANASNRAGWGTSVLHMNPAATWARRVECLPEYLGRMLSVHVECDDAMAVIRRWDSPQTLFYCDPPYPGTAQAYNAPEYTQADFAELCDTLEHCQGSFVLSCYPNAAADAFRWERFDIDANCQVINGEGDRNRTECIWRVDRSKGARPEIQKVWRAWRQNGFEFGGAA